MSDGESITVNTPLGTESTRETPLDDLLADLGLPDAIQALTSGKKIAAGVDSVTGTKDINTGLATVLAVVVSASSDPDGTALAAVSGVITGAAGHFTAKCWKITAANNAALVAADAAKNVAWIAFGT